MTATSVSRHPTLSEEEFEVLAAVEAGTLMSAVFNDSQEGDITFHLRDRCRTLHSLQRKGFITGFRTIQMASGRELPVLKDVLLRETPEALV